MVAVVAEVVLTAVVAVTAGAGRVDRRNRAGRAQILYPIGAPFVVFAASNSTRQINQALTIFPVPVR